MNELVKNRFAIVTCALAFLLGVTAVWAGPIRGQPRSYWVPVAAHLRGVGSSVWRTDVAIHNGCDEAAEIEVVLHRTGETSESISLTLAAGASEVLEDVVAAMVEGEATGSLEIVSDQVLTVRSRTFNVANSGTFGQSLNGVQADDGIDFGESATLAQLQENSAFRCNIGAINMGEISALVEVTLFDDEGQQVGAFELEIPAGEVLQDGRPYLERFGREDIENGYSRVTVLRGTDLFVYASVIDNRTGDPTTVSMDAGTVQPLSETTRRLAEIAISAAGTQSATLLVLEDLDPGSEIVESRPALNLALVMNVPSTQEAWHLVVVDEFPTLRYGHPMTWYLINGTTQEITQTMEVSFLPRINPPFRPAGSLFDVVAEGEIDGHDVFKLTGDGHPVAADYSHKDPAPTPKEREQTPPAKRAVLKRAMVFDAGGPGSEYMYENEAKPMSQWLGNNGFVLDRWSQMIGNGLPYFEREKDFTDAVVAHREVFRKAGSPGGGKCDNFFLYVSAHGSKTDGEPNDSFDAQSVRNPEYGYSVSYNALLAKLVDFPYYVKITVFVDACFSGKLLKHEDQLAQITLKVCSFTVIVTDRDLDGTTRSGKYTDSSTEDFLEGADEDHDGDGNVGDIRDRYLEMEDQKHWGDVGYYHWPDCTSWCVLDGPQNVESACADLSGDYFLAVSDVIDPGGHDDFDGDPLDQTIAFDLSCPTMTATGPAPFVTVSGTTSDQDGSRCGLVADGRGTVAGFDDIAVTMRADIDSQTGTITGTYTFGAEGGLPGGEAITYVFDGTATR